MFQRVYYGDVTHEENTTLPDLQPREWAAVIPIVAMSVAMGIFPNLFLRPTEPAVTRIVERVQSVQPLRVEMQKSKCKMQTECAGNNGVAVAAASTP